MISFLVVFHEVASCKQLLEISPIPKYKDLTSAEMKSTSETLCGVNRNIEMEK